MKGNLKRRREKKIKGDDGTNSRGAIICLTDQLKTDNK